jgi:hypothetical protein
MWTPGRRACPNFVPAAASRRALERWLGEYDVLALRRNNAEPLIVLPWRVWARLSPVNAPASLAQFQQAELRQVDPLLAFVVLAEARALLWQAGELIAAVGQDAVQRILAAAGSDFHDDPIPRWER